MLLSITKRSITIISRRIRTKIILMIMATTEDMIKDSRWATSSLIMHYRDSMIKEATTITSEGKTITSEGTTIT